MARVRVARSEVLTTAEQVRAVFSHPALYRLAALLPVRPDTGRPPQHPPWLLLGYGVLARVFRSGARVENELRQPGIWQVVIEAVSDVQRRYPDLPIPRVPDPDSTPPGWDAWKHVRNRHFTDPDVLAAMQEAFTETAVEQAQALGLLRPDGPGSLTHPDRSRTVYGDGTVVRPMYRPPAARRITDANGRTRVQYLDGDGKPIARPARRFDPDGADYHGHAGPVHGQNFVALYARGDRPHRRVVLAVDRVQRPGAEAETAVEAVMALHEVVGAGMQAVVYDGAMRGRHIDRLMRECGVLVINKVHASSGAKTRRRHQKAAANPPRRPTAAAQPRWFPLGRWEHTAAGTACQHTLVAIDGAVCEVGVDDAGLPVPLGRLSRKQVKRSRRLHGGYHFNVAYEVPCAHGPFLAWVTPHGSTGGDDHRRTDAVRVIAEGEDDFTRLYGLRNDAESFNAHFKRSLLVDRAMSLGAARQLLDVLCYALLNNALTGYRAAAEATRPEQRRRRPAAAAR